jgi:hypothetical protein
MLSKVKTKYRQEGVSGVAIAAIPYFYRNTIRKLMPKVRRPAWNGVEMPLWIRRGDGLFKTNAMVGHAIDRPHYEYGFIKEIDSSLCKGDYVGLIGGGSGVSAVRAAQIVGPSGRVDVYEGAKQYNRRIIETAKLNEVLDRMNINHAIVGEPIQLRGLSGTADIIHPNDLPHFDKLLMDCEGSEQEILRELSFYPKEIVVETHGPFSAPTDETLSILQGLNYDILKKAPAHFEDIEKENHQDIFVIRAKFEANNSQ